MSVTSTITPTQTQLVQQTELDPEFLFTFSGTTVADGSLGFLEVICLCPIDTSILWMLAGGLITGTTSSEVQYNIVLGGATQFRTARPGFPVDGNLILQAFIPPIIMINPQTPGAASSLQIVADNVNTEDLLGEAIAYGWEARVGRNLPQRFFWPATVG